MIRWRHQDQDPVSCSTAVIGYPDCFGLSAAPVGGPLTAAELNKGTATMADHIPVFGICGWSGSGKTTLIEQLLGPLADGGLKVAVIKHDAHGLDVDREGKDSDRFFRAGADVLAQGPEQAFLRTHHGDAELADLVAPLVAGYDLILVEGHKQSAIPKVWLLSDDETAPPPNTGEILAVLPRHSDRLAAVKPMVDEFLADRLAAEPLYGCVLMGGKSTPTRRPRLLTDADGRARPARIVECLEQVVTTIVISGDGEVPDALAGYPRLPGAKDAEGPMSGLLSMMRWCPQASWLVTTCDVPELTPEALRWLASTRTPGKWATLPQVGGPERVEPLLAYYNFRCRTLLEKQAARDNYHLNDLASNTKIASPPVPAELTAAWQNAYAPKSQ